MEHKQAADGRWLRDMERQDRYAKYLYRYAIRAGLSDWPLYGSVPDHVKALIRQCVAKEMGE